MPKDSQKLGGGRQRPVSCHFCRTRKLRCSRDSPCSNCVSRNIPCELEQFSNATAAVDRREREELLERIRKLEAVIESRSDSVAATNANPTPPLSVSSQLEPVAGHHVVTSNRVDCDDANEDRDAFASRQGSSFDLDCAYLKSIYDSGDSTPDEIPSTKVGFRVCPLEHIHNTEELSNESRLGSSRQIFWLPEYVQAKILLEKFESNVHYLHHILLQQSFPEIIDRVYCSLSRQGEVKSGDMILLLAIFTAAMHTWSQDDCRRRGLFKTSEEAQRQSVKWLKATEHLLEVAQRMSKISMEGIEGIIIVGFITASYKGFSRRCWFLMNTAILHARDLGLHCIDHPSNAEFARTANAEVGRRLWWYLTATDWAMAIKVNGLARGTYQCHPRQMMTDKPLNVNDEDVVDGMPRIGKPLSQPTNMSYFLLRIRLNEISRNAVDRTPFLSSAASGPTFDVVMDIDTEMQQLHNDVPPFFSLSPTDITKTYNIDHALALSLARQGNDFYTLFYAQRCRLHLSHARRGYTEPEYAPSRDACIHSARLIIRNETKYHSSGLGGSGGSRYIPLFYSMTVFLACTVLLMDYSYSRSAAYRERQRREICGAVQLLQIARAESDMAARFMDTMIAMLHKHGITPPPPPPSPAKEKSTHEVLPLRPELYHASTDSTTTTPEYQHYPYVDSSIAETTTRTTTATATASATLPDTPLSLLENSNLAGGGPELEGGCFAATTNIQNGGVGVGAGGSSDLTDLVRSLDQQRAEGGGGVVDVGMIDWDDIFVGLEPSFL